GSGESRRQFERRLRARVADDAVAFRVHDRLRRQRATRPRGIALVEEREPGLLAEAHAELLAEAVARDDDARLDLHLADRRVDLANDLAHFLEACGGVRDEQDVAARIDDREAPLAGVRSPA